MNNKILLRNSLRILNEAIVAIQNDKEYTTVTDAIELAKHWIAIEMTIKKYMDISRDTIL